jgi:hypothetical protein
MNKSNQQSTTIVRDVVGVGCCGAGCLFNTTEPSFLLLVLLWSAFVCCSRELLLLQTTASDSFRFHNILELKIIENKVDADSLTRKSAAGVNEE